jgi:hypothetical protein
VNLNSVEMVSAILRARGAVAAANFVSLQLVDEIASNSPKHICAFFHRACEEGHLEVVTALLGAGAYPETEGDVSVPIEIVTQFSPAWKDPAPWGLPQWSSQSSVPSPDSWCSFRSSRSCE